MSFLLRFFLCAILRCMSDLLHIDDKKQTDLIYNKILQLMSVGRTLSQIACMKDANGNPVFPPYFDMLAFLSDTDNQPWYDRYIKASKLQHLSLEMRTQDLHDPLQTREYGRCLVDYRRVED